MHAPLSTPLRRLLASDPRIHRLHSFRPRPPLAAVPAPLFQLFRPRVRSHRLVPRLQTQASTRKIRTNVGPNKAIADSGLGAQEASSSGGGGAAWVCPAGEGAVLVRFGTGIDVAVSERVLACLAQLEAGPWLEGVAEILPAYASLLVHFDPLRLAPDQVEAWVLGAAADAASGPALAATPQREITIPVRYGGAGGPDLAEVARLTGLGSEAAVAAAHAAGDYRVYFLGFLGGFPYLGGLQPPLAAVPRLATPRQALPRGTVGIAGGQTGVYTVSTPGGWHCLGRTAMPLFDPARDPPAVLRAGDLVKFVPSEEEIPEEPPQESPAGAVGAPELPWAEVASPGPLTTVQDLGRYGHGRHGVSRSGAADDLALRTGNALLGNPEDAAALEVTLGGLALRCRGDCGVVVTGADCGAKVRRAGGLVQEALPNRVLHLHQGDALELGYAADGMRAYVCVAGGVDVPAVLGSRSTDVRAKLGGLQGRALQKGDLLGRAPAPLPPRLLAPHDPLRHSSSSSAGGGSGRAWELRVVAGPADPSSGGATSPDLPALLEGSFAVTPRSDRMAVCVAPEDAEGSRRPLPGGQQMSEACVSGTIQLPPDGNPVILLAEHQTTGGYKVPGVVIKADLWKVGQMSPGDTLRFVETSAEEAVLALSEARARALETAPVPADDPGGSPFELAPRAGPDLLKVDLNADAGEGFDDAGLLRYVTSVNVACGGHAGDPGAVARTVALAAAAGAAIGAHPSFEDRANFGRRQLDTAPRELRDQVIWQVSALEGICRSYGTRVRYIKPHGALYHAVLAGGEQGQAVREAAQILGLPLLLMPKSEWATYGEGFAERAYDGDSLRPRDQPGAVIHDPVLAAQQAVQLASRPTLHSICVHGDSPNAVAVAKAVREALDQAGLQVGPFVPAAAAEQAEPAPAPAPAPPNAAALLRESRGVNFILAPDAAPAPAAHTIQSILQEQVAPVIMNGYRPGEGVEPDLWPLPAAVERLEAVMEALRGEAAPPSTYGRFARGEASYEEYIAELRAQLARQGGGWVTVAPRDVCQQGNDSESAAITHVSRMNAEVWAAQAGCVGYEIGGAQYQAGLIRQLDPAAVLRLGLPCNMPAHSLQRSQYVNGLTELEPDVRQALFEATAEVVRSQYGQVGAAEQAVPWHPYNFHAGNYHDESTGYSPQDETTAELLQAGCCPMPVWVFSAKFPEEALSRWTERQIDLFKAAGRRLHCVRIKNPGQGRDWTAESIWAHAQRMIAVFRERGLEDPIIYVHNHDFNGMGAHIGAEVFRLAQAEGFNNMVFDAAYRKNGTHNDNTVLLAALRLTEQQQAALVEYNHRQQQIEKVLSRFNSRESQMTPWDSDWAGGTEGSDIRIAKEYALDVRKINSAKEVATEVFPLERAVTPFSEYKLRLGIGIMIEDGIQPKTAEAVRAWVNGGGKLKVGGDVLLGLHRWETLVPKPAEVGQLLANMPEELEAAMAQKSKLVRPAALPEGLSADQVHTALGYQAKGLKFVTETQPNQADVSPLLVAPHVLHREPKSLPAGTTFELLTNPADCSERLQVTFEGFGRAASGEVTLTFQHEGGGTTVSMVPEPASQGGPGGAAAAGPRQADPSNPHEVASKVPGELVSYAVEEGHVLVEGEPLCTLESMKMEIVISVTADIAGMAVKTLPLVARTKSAAGQKVAPGDLLLEVAPSK